MMEPNDFVNQKVTVMGLGMSGGGLGVARWLLRHGARVVVTDLKSETELESSIAELEKEALPFERVFGEHREKDFIETDLVIKNQAVPNDSEWLVKARQAGVAIDTDIGLFVEMFPGEIAGVTGTKGKTTTATLLYKLARAAGFHAMLGGNVRKSPFDELDNANSGSLAILELSSFQLEILEQKKFSPHVAIWTNLFPDHLDRYPSIEEYAAAKSNIYRFQQKNDYFISTADQEEMIEFIDETTSKKILFSTTKNLDEGVFLENGSIIYKHDGRPDIVGDITKIKIKGEHNHANILASIAGAIALGVPLDVIAEIIETFKGVANRLEEVGSVKGVRYINDTASSIPTSVIAALHSFTAPVILIAGGVDKQLPLRKMATEILRSVKRVVLFNGAVGLKVKDLMIEEDAIRSRELIVQPLAESMAHAVKLARDASADGDVILLSPGASSFDMFQNEFDRGDQFVLEVQKLVK